MNTPWFAEVSGSTSSQGISIQDIKRLVSIRSLLEHYGATLPKFRSTEWISIKCPFHKDAHASAGFNEKIGQFKCHACLDDRGGDVLDLVMQQEHLTMKEALQWLRDRMMN